MRQLWINGGRRIKTGESNGRGKTNRLRRRTKGAKLNLISNWKSNTGKLLEICIFVIEI